MLFAQDPNASLELAKIIGTVAAAFVGASIAAWLQRRKAKEDREHTRKEDAYRSGAETVTLIMALTDARPDDRSDGLERITRPTEDAAVLRSNALINLFGSEEARRRMTTVRGSLSLHRLAHVRFQQAVDDVVGSPLDGTYARPAFDDLKQHTENESRELRTTEMQLLVACEHLLDQMRAELGVAD